MKRLAALTCLLACLDTAAAASKSFAERVLAAGERRARLRGGLDVTVQGRCGGPWHGHGETGSSGSRPYNIYEAGNASEQASVSGSVSEPWQPGTGYTSTETGGYPYFKAGNASEQAYASGNASEPALAFPECVFINLARRVDRRERLQSQLDKIGLKCKRIEACDAMVWGQAPVEACRDSHLNALDSLKRSGAPYGLVLEDDAIWTQDVSVVKESLARLTSGMRDHPMILAACQEMRPMGAPALQQPGLRPVRDCQTTSAYVVRQDYITRLQELFGKAGMHNPIDLTWKEGQWADNWAMMSPLIVKQGASYSDIDQAHVDRGCMAGNRTSNHTS